MGWWITLGILVLLAILPLGVSVKYDGDGPLVRIIAGPARVAVFPAPKKEKKEKKQKPKPAKQPTPKQQSPSQNPQPPKPAKDAKAQKANGGSWTDFLPLVKEVFRFLDVFRRKLRLNVLELKLIMAADDPCDLAVNYGRAWAAVGNLLPQLERVFVIKKRDIEVECDFTASETLVIARLDLTITLGRLLGAVVVFGVRALREFLKIKKKRKGGAET